MPTYSIDEAQAELESLIDRAENGEQIDVLTASGGLVRIEPLSLAEKARLAGEPIG